MLRNYLEDRILIPINLPQIDEEAEAVVKAMKRGTFTTRLALNPEVIEFEKKLATFQLLNKPSP